MSGWRIALRIAWREARRAKGRAALVAALITLPVAALSFAAVSYDSFELTPGEQADRLMGGAQAVITWPYGGPVEQEPDRLFAFPVGGTGPPAEPSLDRLLALLPAGATAIPDQHGALTMRTAAGTGTISARTLDYTDPLAAGILRQLSGRAPAGADEVVLTPAASSRLGVGDGGAIHLADGSRTFRVVGTVEEPDELEAGTIVGRPGALPLDSGGPAWLVATPGPLTWAEVKRLNTSGVVAVSRHVLANPPGPAERYRTRVTEAGLPPGTLILVGGLGMLEIVLLAGPAFAISARRRRRDLALVAAAGGRPAQVRRIVLADGVVLGVLSAGAGVALGVAAAAALRAPLESWLGFRSGAFRIFPVALAVLAGLAVVTGVLAALVPAWISSRQDVVTALTGRRGITRSKRRWVIVGVALIAAGAGLVALGAVRIDETTMVAGVFLAELGLVLCTPAIVGLVARLGRWLPLAARIALQDTSRNRTAAAPAVAAVMAVVIFSVALGIVYLSLRARDASESAGRPGDVTVFQTDRDGAPSQTISQEAIRTVRELMPVDQVYEIQMPRCGFGPCLAHPELPAVLQCPYPPFDSTPDQQRAARSDPRCDGVGAQHVYFGAIGIGQGVAVIVDETAVAAVAVVSQEDADRVVGAMRGGAVVVSDPRYLENGRVTLAVEAIGSNQQRTLTAPAVALPHRPKAPIALMTAATARTLGFDPVPFMTLATTTRVPTLAEEDRLQAALGSQFHVSVLRAVQPADDRTLVVLAIVAAVITIGAAALATGLAAADGRADLGTLAAVGASPRLRRVLSLSQTGVIAGLGSVLGVAAGLGLSTAVLFALNQRFADTWPVPTPIPVTVPWLNVGIALLVVPLIAMLGTGLLTRSRLPIERRL